MRFKESPAFLREQAMCMTVQATTIGLKTNEEMDEQKGVGMRAFPRTHWALSSKALLYDVIFNLLLKQGFVNNGEK